MSQPPSYRTAEDAALILRTSIQFVMGECRAGSLRASKVGGSWLITDADLTAYVETRANQAEPAPRRRKKRRP